MTFSFSPSTDTIRRKPHAKLFKLLQGYLAGYLAVLTGHRPVVLANLQKDTVREAEMDTQNRAVMWVREGLLFRGGRSVSPFFPRGKRGGSRFEHRVRTPPPNTQPTVFLLSFQVDQHKTDRAYGNAFLALLPREVDWLKGLMEVSAHFGGEDCPYVFQFNGKQLSKLNTELRAAWHHAGMPGQISFSLIRTTIANQVRGEP